MEQLELLPIEVAKSKGLPSGEFFFIKCKRCETLLNLSGRLSSVDRSCTCGDLRFEDSRLYYSDWGSIGFFKMVNGHDFVGPIPSIIPPPTGTSSPQPVASFFYTPSNSKPPSTF